MFIQLPRSRSGWTTSAIMARRTRSVVGQPSCAAEMAPLAQKDEAHNAYIVPATIAWIGDDATEVGFFVGKAVK